MSLLTEDKPDEFKSLIPNPCGKNVALEVPAWVLFWEKIKVENENAKSKTKYLITPLKKIFYKKCHHERSEVFYNLYRLPRRFTPRNDVLK
jgi:hypothetical protein